MAINNKKLKDLFGTEEPKEEPKKEVQKNEVFDIFSEDENESKEETSQYTIEYSEDDVDDMLPSASVSKELNTKPFTQQNLTDDINYALKTQTDLINKSQQLVQIALHSAAEDGTARDIEVAAGAINTASASVEKLLDLYEKLKKLTGQNTEQASTGGNTFVQNQVIYQGTTSDLLKQMEEGTLDVNKL